MKPQFVFYFADEPHFASAEPRYHVAHLLRSYRAHPERYELRRESAHRYSVRPTYRAGLYGPQMAAIIEPATLFYGSQS